VAPRRPMMAPHLALKKRQTAQVPASSRNSPQCRLERRSPGAQERRKHQGSWQADTAFGQCGAPSLMASIAHGPRVAVTEAIRMRETGLLQVDVEYEFLRARRPQFLATLAHRLRVRCRDGNRLVSLDEVVGLAGRSGQAAVGPSDDPAGHHRRHGRVADRSLRNPGARRCAVRTRPRAAHQDR
jgi:hypothetical protein